MKKNALKKELDWFSMLVPLAIVLAICALFVIFPEESKLALSVVRGFLGDDFGLYYALLGVGIVGCTLYIAYNSNTQKCIIQAKSRSIVPSSGER